MKIVTDYAPPPIPDRRYDWSAYDDHTYDGSPGSVIGWGRTEAEAIADFKEQMEDDPGTYLDDEERYGELPGRTDPQTGGGE